MKILSAKDYGVLPKATLQATGKLGFSQAAVTALELDENKSVRFGQDEEDDDALYLAVTEDNTEDTFHLNRSGDYYNINTRALFFQLGVDYTNKQVIYDLLRNRKQDEAMGGAAYRMEPRFLPRKNREAAEENTTEHTGREEE